MQLKTWLSFWQLYFNGGIIMKNEWKEIKKGIYIREMLDIPKEDVIQYAQKLYDNMPPGALREDFRKQMEKNGFHIITKEKN
jgi:hypothetical protein